MILLFFFSTHEKLWHVWNVFEIPGDVIEGFWTGMKLRDVSVHIWCSLDWLVLTELNPAFHSRQVPRADMYIHVCDVACGSSIPSTCFGVFLLEKKSSPSERVRSSHSSVSNAEISDWASGFLMGLYCYFELWPGLSTVRLLLYQRCLERETRRITSTPWFCQNLRPSWQNLNRLILFYLRSGDRFSRIILEHSSQKDEYRWLGSMMHVHLWKVGDKSDSSIIEKFQVDELNMWLSYMQFNYVRIYGKK